MVQPTYKPVPAGGIAARGGQLGESCSGESSIYVYEDVLAQVVRYSETDLERELGGVLLGGLHEHRRVYVEVRAFVPALGAASQAASVTFTGDTWAEMARRSEADHPGELVLGWHHTHPRLGVFLSAHDLFIHRHFFSQPWQIALVVDPCQRQIGFFQWRGEQVVDCGFVVARRERTETAGIHFTG
jgi:proteasome lid subunit RPN8/RPN11